MTYDYQKNRDYQLDYQKTSERAKEARRRYYQKNKGKWNKYKDSYRKDPRLRAKAILTGCKHRATKRGLEFDLSLEDVFPFPEVCPVLGIPLNLFNSKTSPDSPSIDRIDNTKGYVRGNIRVISLRANTLKSNGTTEEFKKIIEYMQNYTN